MALTGLRGRRSHLKSEDARSLYPTMLCTGRKASRKLLCPHDVDDKLILLECLFPRPALSAPPSGDVLAL